MIFVIVYSYQADEFIEKYKWIIFVVLLLAGVVGLGVRGEGRFSGNGERKINFYNKKV